MLAGCEPKRNFAPKLKTMANFRVGDRVSFLDDVGGGKIIRMESEEEAMIESDDGFEIPYPVDQLVLVGSREEQEEAYELDKGVIDGFVEKRVLSEKEEKKEEEFDRKFRHVPPMKKKKEDVVEVDLHIHQLVDDDSGLEPYQIRDVQMRHFERMIETAIRDKRDKVVFIHGKGQGILKNEIRKALEFYPECTFRDAPFHTYGYHGATEVSIHQA